MAKIKIILKNIGIGIGVFIGCYVVSFLILLSSALFLHDKSIISDTISTLITFLGALLVAIIGVTTFFIRRKKNKYKYFSAVGAKVLFAIYMIQGFLLAFRSGIILTIEAAQKLVEIEWMIFSIAITLFVVWHAIVSKMLEKKFNNDNFGENRLIILEYKRQTYSNATSFFYNLVLLFVSLASLVIITSSVYTSTKLSLIIQFILLFNSSIVINAVMVIFYDIAVPLIVNLETTRKSKMTDEQVEEAKQLAELEEYAVKILNKSMTKEDITAMIKEILKKEKENKTEDLEVPQEQKEKEQNNELSA